MESELVATMGGSSHQNTLEGLKESLLGRRSKFASSLVIGTFLSSLAAGVLISHHESAVLSNIGLSTAAAVILTLAVFRFEWVLFLTVMSIPLNYIDLVSEVGIVISPTRAMLPILVFGWVAQSALGRRPKADPFDLHIKLRQIWPLLLLLLLIAVSVVFSRDQGNSLSKLPALVANLVYWLIILDAVRTPEQFRRLCLAAAIAIALVAVTASYGFLSAPSEYLSGIDRITATVRAGSLFDQANRTAHTVSSLYPFMLFSIVSTRSALHRRALIVIAALSVLGLLLTFSRGGMLAFLLGLLTVCRRQIVQARGMLLAAVLLAILLLSPFCGLWAMNLEGRATDEKRLQVLVTGVKSALEYPLTGVGYGNFEYTYRYVATDWPPNLSHRVYTDRNLSPHNLYLMFLVETGLLSLLLWVLFWGLALISLIRLDRDARAMRGTGLPFLVLCLQGAALAVFTSRLVNTGFGDMDFWTVLGMLVCGISIAARRLKVVDQTGQEPITLSKAPQAGGVF